MVTAIAALIMLLAALALEPRIERADVFALLACGVVILWNIR